MPIIKALQLGVTAGGARTVASSNSWQKYPMVFVKSTGERVTIEPNINALDTFGEMALAGEKERLLVLKQEGYKSNIKDTTARYKTPAKEWDHLLLSFDKEESFLLTDEEKARYREALIKGFSDPDAFSGNGRRMVAISEGHDDTGDFHFHILVHRHGVDHENKYIHTALDLGRYSEASHQANLLNLAVAEADLEQISDWVGMQGSIYEDSGTSNEAKAAVTQAIQEAGGEADLTTQPSKAPGAMRAEREEQPGITPEEKQIQDFVDFNKRDALRLQEGAQRAAQQVALGQHALAALQETKLAKAAKEQAEFEKNAALEEVGQLKEEVAGIKTTLEDVSSRLTEHETITQRVAEAFEGIVSLMPDAIKKLPIEDQSVWLSNTMATASNEFIALAEQQLAPKTITQQPVSEQVAWLATEFKNVTQSNEVLDKQVNKQKEQLTKAAEDQATLQKAQEETKRELQVVSKDLTETKTREEKLVVKVDELSEVNAAAKKELHSATAQVKALSSQLAAASTIIKQSEELTQQQRSMIESQSAQLTQSQDLIKRNEQALGQQTKTIETFEQKLAKTEQKVTSYEKELDDLKNQLKQALAEAQSLRKAAKPDADGAVVLQKDIDLARELRDKEKNKDKGPKNEDEGGPK
jgi:hypothetical protein